MNETCLSHRITCSFSYLHTPIPLQLLLRDKQIQSTFCNFLCRNSTYMAGHLCERQLYRMGKGKSMIKSRRMRWAGHVALMGEERGVYRVLVGKPEGNHQHLINKRVAVQSHTIFSYSRHDMGTATCLTALQVCFGCE